MKIENVKDQKQETKRKLLLSIQDACAEGGAYLPIAHTLHVRRVAEKKCVHGRRKEKE